MKEHLHILYNGESLLIKCRMALMLAYYADTLFQHNEDLFIQTVEFLVKSMHLYDGEQKALALQAADTLKTIIADVDLVMRIETFINKLVVDFSQMVSTTQLPGYFDIMMTIVQSYSDTLDKSVVGLVSALVSRIQSELLLLRNEGRRNNIIINQCWNVIRTICEQDNFVPYFLVRFDLNLIIKKGRIGSCINSSV